MLCSSNAAGGVDLARTGCAQGSINAAVRRAELPDLILTGSTAMNRIAPTERESLNARRHVPKRAAEAIALVALVPVAGCAVSDASYATRRALLRHASFRGIEAKFMVGKTIDEAIAKYGRAARVVSIPEREDRSFNDIPMAGKDLYAFERDRTDYTVDVARGSEIGQSSQGPVIVQRYERVNRTAVCTLVFIVDPATRRILTYDIGGNCV
ncbi:hypothetical protein [Piscinibacterium candidicorallinum]|uniref:Uncharacterized protein n=1 Tax=Piscinibacterium candidicorallinum TaxID=1793872 RepID=A0ABV7H3S3_9BURK